MTLFFTVLGACALGTFCALSFFFWLVGVLAIRQEKKQREQLRKLQEGYLEMAKRERTRLERYAKMEG